MNRDLGRGTDTLQQASSSNYLIYLFVFSASFVVLLPYLLPFGGSLLRSSKKGSGVEKVKGSTLKTSAPYTYTSLSTDAIVPRNYIYESKHEDLQMRIMDLQRTIQIERERTFQLENEIRILHLSERYLKERIQKLEDRSLEHRRGFSTDSVSIELLLQNTANVQSKQDAYVQELRRMLQVEKERTNNLALEIKVLRMSESILVDRIKTLEDKFNAFLSNEGRSKHFDSKYEQRDLAQN